MKPEDYLRNFLWKNEILEIWPVGKKTTRRMRYKILDKEFAPTTYTDFIEEQTLFGSHIVGTKTHPKRIDLLATPVLKKAELTIVELKVENLTSRDFLQLLGYINFFRYLQKYGGKTGINIISKHMRFDLTPRTKIRGILIGKSFNPQLTDCLVDELTKIVRVCTYKIKLGSFPEDIQEILIHDKGFDSIQEMRRRGRKLHRMYNQKIAG
ncbi:MAG: hypothetical protein IIB44_11960 [Candidatus Marinimicrobia bacterium]|nr:hypothetical protein [Candidatus Neomarinimicrobiota bacterium]